jgi:thioredoxin 1
LRRGKEIIKMGNLAHIKDAEFQDQVIKSTLPVLVDFWAPWCGPCAMMSPILEKVAEIMKGRVLIVKMNVDENGETAEHYSISAIPTLMLFKNGTMAQKSTGFMKEQDLIKFIEENL